MPGCLSRRHADPNAYPTGGQAAASAVDQISLYIAAALAAGGSGGAASREARRRDHSSEATGGAAASTGVTTVADDGGGCPTGEAAAPIIRGGAAGRAEAQQRISSIAVVALAQASGDCDIEDVLVPDIFTDDSASSEWL